MVNSFSQHRMLLGTAQTSNKVWGIKNINFPCGYHLPNAAFAKGDQNIIIDFDIKNYWVLGGLALEIKKTGKNIEPENCSSFIKGYRPWISIYKNQLIKELEERKHTIMIWDKGVSIFYGLWRDNSHKIGDLININNFEKYKTLKCSLHIDSTQEIEGEAPEEYIQDSEKIVNFMSKFMTLSKKDIYVLGPIVAKKLSMPVSTINLKVLNNNFNVEIINK